MGKCIITYKGKKYSEEQFKEYFINNKQEFITSIAKNKDVIDSFKRKMEGIDSVFSQSPELASIGSKVRYLQYLSTIFKTSKVKDIVYHGTDTKFDNFNKDFIGSKEKGALAYGFNFGGQQARVYAGNFGKGEKVLLSNLVSLQNPLILKGEGKYATASYPNFKENNFLIDILKKNGYDVTQWQYYKNSDNGKIFDYVTQKVGLKNFTNILKKEGYDGVLSITQSKENPEIVVFEPEQIHVMGGKTDIQGFKDFMSFENSEFSKYGTYQQFRDFVGNQNILNQETSLNNQYNQRANASDETIDRHAASYFTKNNAFFIDHVTSEAMFDNIKSYLSFHYPGIKTYDDYRNYIFELNDKDTILNFINFVTKC